MNSVHLVIDLSYICRRALHTTGGMVHNGMPTGVLFGVFRDLDIWVKQFDADNVLFCLDKRPYLRSEVYPDYKWKDDSEWTQEDYEAFEALDSQINLLPKLLHYIGFNNIYAEVGFEADDHIASVAHNVDGTKIIISADQDLYQCLAPDTVMFSPANRKLMTVQTFRDEYHGIDPADWSLAKAIAGCKSDNIRGVHKVGEKTAAKYLAGRLGMKTKAYRDIVAAEEQTTFNHQLTQLPMFGCPEPVITPDNINPKKWKKVMRYYGLKSLVDAVPRSKSAIRRKQHGKGK